MADTCIQCGDFVDEGLRHLFLTSSGRVQYCERHCPLVLDGDRCTAYYRKHKRVKSSVERLIDRIRQEVPEITQKLDPKDFHRTRSGYWQRAAGAWSWAFNNTVPSVGSQHSVAELLKCKKITFSAANDYELIIENEDFG